MKRLTGWTRLGIVLSLAWIILTSIVYVNEIYNHPSYGATCNLHRYFNWVDDPKATERAHIEAKAEDKDFSNRFVFMKPVFRVSGYFKLAFLPAILGWCVAWLGVAIFRWVREGFRT